MSNAGRLGGSFTLQPARARSIDVIKASGNTVSFDVNNEVSQKSALKKKKKSKRSESVDNFAPTQMIGFSPGPLDEEFIEKRLKFLDKKFKQDMDELIEKDPAMQLEQEKKEKKRSRNSDTKSNKSQQEVDYAGMVVEEIETEIDRCLELFETNERKVLKIRKDGKKHIMSERKIEEKIKPVPLHSKFLRERVAELGKLKNVKIPIQEKLP